MDTQNIQNSQDDKEKRKKFNESIFEDVLAALYDQDVAYTKLKRTCSEITKFGGVRD